MFPHYGYIDAEMEAPPDKLDGFFVDVAQIAADLRTTPVTDDELERAKKPAIEALEKATATNEYWLDGLAGAQADPRRLDAPALGGGRPGAGLGRRRAEGRPDLAARRHRLEAGDQAEAPRSPPPTRPKPH